MLIEVAQARTMAARIESACKNPGYFQVPLDNADAVALDRTLASMHRFFSLADSDPLKQAAHKSLADHIKGWTPRLEEPAYQPGTVSQLEAFDFGQQLTETQYQDLQITPNLWPELRGFRHNAMDFYARLTSTARTLASAFSLLLGQRSQFLNENSGPAAARTMRLLRYPAHQGDTAVANEVGISAHTDFECFTLLYQSAPGLELRGTDEQWLLVPHQPGRFTVIVGDMLERLSNGEFRATGHRVAHNSWERFSIALFFALDNHFRVEPLPKFVTADNPAAYAPVTQGDHIANEIHRAQQNAA